MQKNGFTLIEIMVSVTIFAIVMVISLGALLSISAADRKAETLKSVVDNLNFALDSMSRTLRTGQYYDCGAPASIPPSAPVPTDCSGSAGRTAIAFQASNNSLPECSGQSGNCIVKYCRGDAATLTCSDTGTSILRVVNSNSPATLTSPDVTISDLHFYVIGACSSSASGCTTDTIQPKVTITLSGEIAITPNQKSEFHLETSVTQRLYDY